MNPEKSKIVLIPKEITLENNKIYKKKKTNNKNNKRSTRFSCFLF